jgi:hypothetical protein
VSTFIAVTCAEPLRADFGSLTAPGASLPVIVAGAAARLGAADTPIATSTTAPTAVAGRSVIGHCRPYTGAGQRVAAYAATRRAC